MNVANILRQTAELLPLPDDAGQAVMAEFERIRQNNGQSRAYQLRDKMQKIMTENVGVFRVEEGMAMAVDRTRQTAHRIHCKSWSLMTKGKNTTPTCSKRGSWVAC